MMRHFDRLMIRWAPRWVGLAVLLAVGIDGCLGQWFSALGLLPAAGLLLIYPRSLNLAFQSGWRASARSYDEALTERLDATDRMLMLASNHRAMPTYSQHMIQSWEQIQQLDAKEERRER